MNMDLLKRLAMFIVFGLAQVLVLNHIHLLGYATPLLYVYFVLMFPRNYPQWAILLWCFTLGLCVDVSLNTPGLAAASMTFIGLLQPYLLRPFIPRDSVEDLVPSLKTLGIGKFATYAIVLVLIYTLVFFSLEAFNFFNWQQWMWCVVGSALLTLVLIFVLENVRN